MRLVISYDGLKRTIDGEFAICADAATLSAIKEAIEDKLLDNPRYHGWLDVRELVKPLPITANQEPIGWKE